MSRAQAAGAGIGAVRAAAAAAVLIALGSGAGSARADTDDDQVQFESCTILYQAGDYETAAACYRAMIDDGVNNGLVHADLANALLHLDRFGEAIHHYRVAQLFRPRDSEIRGDLTRARRAAGVDVDGPPRPPIAHVLFFYDTLSPGELWWITAALNLLLWTLLAVRLARRGEILTWTSIVVGLATVLFAVTATLRHTQLATRPDAVVLSGTAVARSARDRGAAEMMRLAEGVEVRVVARQGGWLAVESHTGKRGWVEAPLLGVIEYRAGSGVGSQRGTAPAGTVPTESATAGPEP